MKFLLFLTLFVILLSPKAQTLIPFGDVRIGDAPLPIDLADYHPYATHNKNKVNVSFVNDSVQWLRDTSNLLIPRARLKVEIKNISEPPLFYYLGEVFSGEFRKEDDSYSVDLWINLFNPGKITIKRGKDQFAQIIIDSKVPNGKSTKLIDYSCAPYDVTFEGLEDQYMSVGCRLESIGPSMERKPRLIVTWSAANALLLDDKLPPYRTVLHGDNPSLIKVRSNQGKVTTVKIKANLPTRLHRLKTAIGFGPYLFESTSGNLRRPEKWAPAFMFYGKYDLLESTSIRFFNATVSRGSLFNNGGVYLAYEIASLFDNRLKIIPLLGAQILTFDYNKEVPERHKIIYPQGFEAVWQHSFGLKNYSLIYGMFISGSDTEPYKNLWLRWGKRFFGEINYIEWSAGTQKVKTYGLSVGLPFLSFF